LLANAPVRRFRVVVCLFAPALLTGHTTTGQAATVNYAGLVVRHADRELTYAFVGFAEPEISGIELLRRSGLDLVTVAFGGLGEGVCSIDAHGCPATDCRKRVCQGPKVDDPFWQYFRQSTPGAGDWSAVPLGGSATRVRDGDLDGWSWTGTTPDLPPITLAEVATLAGYNGVAFDGNPPASPGAVFTREGTIADDRSSLSVRTAAIAIALLLAAAITTLLVVKWRQDRPWST
jgi:hypothetical protein